MPFWQEPKELVSHSLPAPPGPGRAMQAMEMLMVDALVVFFFVGGGITSPDVPEKKGETELNAGKMSCRMLEYA